MIITMDDSAPFRFHKGTITISVQIDGENTIRLAEVLSSLMKSKTERQNNVKLLSLDKIKADIYPRAALLRSNNSGYLGLMRDAISSSNEIYKIPVWTWLYG